jgi:hypothetical protein
MAEKCNRKTKDPKTDLYLQMKQARNSGNACEYLAVKLQRWCKYVHQMGDTRYICTQ